MVSVDKIYNESLNAIPLNTIPSDDSSSCTLHVVLFAVFLITSVILGSSFIHFHWYKKMNN